MENNIDFKDGIEYQKSRFRFVEILTLFSITMLGVFGTFCLKCASDGDILEAVVSLIFLAADFWFFFRMLENLGEICYNIGIAEKLEKERKEKCSQ